MCVFVSANMISFQLFEVDNFASVKLDFGIEKLVKPLVSGIVVESENRNEISGIYDFARPCPPLCDTYSPLLP